MARKIIRAEGGPKTLDHRSICIEDGGAGLANTFRIHREEIHAVRRLDGPEVRVG